MRTRLIVTAWLVSSTLAGLTACDGILDSGPPERVFAGDASAPLAFAPTDDTLVKSRYPHRNYDSREFLRVRDRGQRVIQSYLRFEVSGVEGNAVQHASLRLHAYDGSSDGGTLYRAASDDWREETLVYERAPGPVGGALDSAGKVKANTWVELDVTAALAGDGPVSFVLTSQSSNSVYYDAREASRPPELRVWLAPEPSSADAGGTNGDDPDAGPPDSGESDAGTPPADAAPPPPTGESGIWISPEEVQALPMSGAAWENVLSTAQQDTSSPNLSDQEDQTDAAVMAKAFVYVRTGDSSYREQVVAAIQAARGTETGGRTLALGRNLAAYVIAAELVGLDGDADDAFRTWLDGVRYEELSGRTLISTHDDRPNNWGTHAGAARIAADLYLGDTADLEKAAAVFRGWLGDRNAYADFSYGDLSWQCDPSKPVGINPPGCTIEGHSVDGVLPDDQRRAGSFTWPPPKENYVWEALQGATAQAWMLHRAGFPAFEWEQQALRRAVAWLHEQADFPAEGDDTGTPWLINAMYGTDFPTSEARPGKNGLAWYDWTHAP